MEIFHSVLQFDKWLFQLINGDLGNPVFDFLMPIVREKKVWLLLYLYLAYHFFATYRLKGWFLVLGFVLSVGISDFTSSSLIKKSVQRIRPCNDVEMVDRVVTRVSCGGGYSFTSSHASNHFAIAVFLITALGLSGKWQQRALLAWAGSIAFAQVYVGVHYPIDVTAGATLGSLIGWGTGRIIRDSFLQKSKSQS